MAVVTKPPVTTDVFADSASGSPDIAPPTYMSTGFPLTAGPGSQPVKPPRGFINWLFNYCMAGVRYLFQRGITDWDSAEDGYVTGAAVQDTGNIWRLVGSATTGTAPHLDQGNWAPLQRDKTVNDVAGGASTSFDGSANPTTWNDMLTADGAPISGLDVLPTYAAGSGFNSAVGAGSGFLYTSVGIGAGESTYRTIAWAGQSVLHSNPDPSSPRYDAITVTPAPFGTASVLAVVTGTPSTTPLAPAIPSGSAALFYVYVGNAVADATHFRACRGLGRRVGYPWSGMSAIVAGCELSWNYTADPSAAPADIFVGAADQTGTNFTLNRLLIDGEAIEWAGYLSNTTNGVVSDSTADPFGTAASGSFDTPYYIYAVGGRHNPMPCNTGTGILNPITVCESTVPPNPKTGKPTGNLTVNGVTVSPNGAVYIGLGFVALDTQFRRGCLMDGEMTHSLMPMQQITHAFTTAGREDAGTFTGGCQPAISTKMRVSLAGVTASGINTQFALYIADHPTPTTPFSPYGPGFIMLAIGGGGSVPTAFEYLDINFTPRQGAEIWVLSEPATGSAYGVLVIGARAFNHRVRRIVAGY